MVVATNGLTTIVVGNSERCQVSFGYRFPGFVTGRMDDDTFVKKCPIGGERTPRSPRRISSTQPHNAHIA